LWQPSRPGLPNQDPCKHAAPQDFSSASIGGPRHNIPRLQHQNDNERHLDLVDKQLSPDMMDQIVFRTFNEVRVKNRSVFLPQNCTHDFNISLPVPSKIRQQKIEK